MQKFNIEIIVPDDAGNEEQTFAAAMLELFHNAFKGKEDYVNSNVFLSNISKGKVNDSTEGTVTVNFCNCKDKIYVATWMFNAITDVFKSPEFKGVLFDEQENK